MLRTRPLDGDTLFQVNYTTANPDDAPQPGPRHCATFAKTFIEAIHLARNQFGDAGAIAIVEVYARERDKDGTIRDTYFYPERKTVTTPAAELNIEFADARAADG